MCSRFTSKDLNNGLNETRGKTHRTISKKCIKKDTFNYRNGVNMRDREDVMTCYLKEKIVKLSKLTWVYFWVRSPSNWSSTKKRHRIIYRNRLSVWKGRSTNKTYVKSIRYYFLSNLKFFTCNPSSQVMTTCIIRMNREIPIAFSNQSNRGRIKNLT